VSSRDEGAFARILQRHGALVFGVCQQVLALAKGALQTMAGQCSLVCRREDSGDRVSGQDGNPVGRELRQEDPDL
jgi:hypothetical protein